ncbi:MAG: RNA pyrophosphohydrolase [Boseongicola sp.]|nr:RNA pyrophosphohydrolase [Boseongicola sp.]MYH57668.1 RNA pyrophosphohydrolase [Boseongicola sp. SB0675_bin_26]
MSTSLPYRPCAGVALANGQGLVFTGERVDTPGAWQMPQGGVDSGETPRAAAFRELEEETGVAPALVTLEREHPDWILYDLPEHLVGRLWNGRYRGQMQRWFLMRFHGADSDIDLDQEHREFSRWRWSAPDEVIGNIVPFKRDVYEQVIAAFRPHLSVSP